MRRSVFPHALKGLGLLPLVVGRVLFSPLQVASTVTGLPAELAGAVLLVPDFARAALVPVDVVGLRGEQAMAAFTLALAAFPGGVR